MDSSKAKKAAAERAVSYIQAGMIVGLGTGSTARFAIEKVGQLHSEGVELWGVPTSSETEKLAKENGIPLKQDFTEIDLTIDGADEVDGDGRLIKGGGGALMREKIVAAASKREIIIVDRSKHVEKLGAFPLPVEVLPFGWQWVHTQLTALGGKCTLRKRGGTDFITDNSNLILDCQFGAIKDPAALAERINAIPGVLENGLFIGLTHTVITGYEDGRVEERRVGRRS